MSWKSQSGWGARSESNAAPLHINLPPTRGDQRALSTSHRLYWGSNLGESIYYLFQRGRVARVYGHPFGCRAVAYLPQCLLALRSSGEMPPTLYSSSLRSMFHTDGKSKKKNVSAPCDLSTYFIQLLYFCHGMRRHGRGALVPCCTCIASFVRLFLGCSRERQKCAARSPVLPEHQQVVSASVPAPTEAMY